MYRAPVCHHWAFLHSWRCFFTELKILTFTVRCHSVTLLIFPLLAQGATPGTVYSSPLGRRLATLLSAFDDEPFSLASGTLFIVSPVNQDFFLLNHLSWIAFTQVPSTPAPFSHVVCELCSELWSTKTRRRRQWRQKARVLIFVNC